MSVVYILCNILILVSTVRVWAPYVAFPTYGVHPHYATIRSIPAALRSMAPSGSSLTQQLASCIGGG